MPRSQMLLPPFLLTWRVLLNTWLICAYKFSEARVGVEEFAEGAVVAGVISSRLLRLWGKRVRYRAEGASARIICPRYEAPCGSH